MKLLYKTALLFVLLFSAVGVFAQQSDVGAGIELYNKGDFQGAVAKLKDKEEVVALYYLALSYDKLNQSKEAGETFEKAFKKTYETVSEDLANRLDVTNKSEKVSFAEFLRNQKLRIQIGAVSADNAVRLKAKMSKQYEWLSKGMTMVGLFELLKTTETLYAFDEVQTEPKIQKKPLPKYTDAARRGNVTGRVKLLIVLAADGTVKNVVPVESLPGGLTEQAIEVAKQIQFEPAVKDGKAVSTVKIVEYSFSIY